MMIDFCSLYSGSSGNCIVVGDGNSHLLIDAGVSGKKIEQALNLKGLSTKDMSGILITHEHSDHVQGIGVLARRYGLPMYLTKGTLTAIKRMDSLGKIDESLFHVISEDVDFSIDNLSIHPIKISHDAAQPVAYKISNGGKSVAVMTDLGIYDDYIVDNISGLDALLIESNHDIRMLQTGPYSYPLKMRILSDSGHLSNENAGRLLSRVLHDGLSHIFLGHLSHENNYPELAFETVRSEIDLSDNDFRSIDFDIEVASRFEPSKMIFI